MDLIIDKVLDFAYWVKWEARRKVRKLRRRIAEKPRKVILGFLVYFTAFAILATIGWIEIGGRWLDPPIPNFGENSIVYTSDGKTVLGSIRPVGPKHSTPSSQEYSPLVKRAFLSAEDRSYYTHGGISATGIFRAMVTNVRAGAIAAGGSTITQQLAKNLFSQQQQTFSRKFSELQHADWLEHHYTKDQILTMYLNSNYYGRGAYGLEDASWAWFGHSATAIDNSCDPYHVAKAAFLAALVNRPSDYEKSTPDHPDQLVYMSDIVSRQTYIIDNMDEFEEFPQDIVRVPGDITIEAKHLLPIKVSAKTAKPSSNASDLDPYLHAYIREWIAAWKAQTVQDGGKSNAEKAEHEGRDYANELLARGGLQIRVSIEPNLQALLSKAVKARMPKSPTAGIVILNQDGGVAAMYGGSDYSQDQFNDALYAEREPGSIMSAFVLADLARNGIALSSQFAAPAYADIGGTKFWNANKTASAGCKSTLADALAKSNDVVFAEAISGEMVNCHNKTLTPIDADYPVSPKSVAALAVSLGANDSLVPGKHSPSVIDETPKLAIGESPTTISPLKLASMGLTLANGGMHTKPHVVEEITANNKKAQIYKHKAQTSRALATGYANVTNFAMKGVFTYGTARDARLDDHPLAGKTSRTDKDSWALVYNASDPKGKVPTYACSAWVQQAIEKNNRAYGNPWGTDEAKICQYFFRGALQGKPRVDFSTVNTDADWKIVAP